MHYITLIKAQETMNKTRKELYVMLEEGHQNTFICLKFRPFDLAGLTFVMLGPACRVTSCHQSKHCCFCTGIIVKICNLFMTHSFNSDRY
jgi:hypothetical protein